MMPKFTRTPTMGDLHSGFVVVLRNGKAGIVVRAGEAFNKYILTDNGHGCIHPGLYTSDLRVKSTAVNGGPELDIMEIYGLVSDDRGLDVLKALRISPAGRPLLWKRPEAVKLTVEEIAEKLGYEVQIVASH